MENYFAIANNYYLKKDYQNALKYFLKSDNPESIYNAGVTLLTIIKERKNGNFKDVSFMVNATKKLFVSGYLNVSSTKDRSLFNLIYTICKNKEYEKNFFQVTKALIGMIFLLKESFSKDITLDEIEKLYSFVAPYAFEKRQMDKINYEDKNKYITIAKDYIEDIYEETPINLKEVIYNKLFEEEQDYSTSYSVSTLRKALQKAYNSETLDSYDIKVISEEELDNSLRKKREEIQNKWRNVIKNNPEQTIVVEYHKERGVFEVVKYDGPKDKIIETIVCKSNTTRKYNNLKKKLLNMYNTENFIEV